jgi:hypothetical protein
MSDKISELTASSKNTSASDSEVGRRRFNSGDNPWHEGDENVIDTDEEPVRRRRLLHLPQTIGSHGLVSRMSPPTMYKIGETALLTRESASSVHNKGNKTNKKEKAKKAKKTVKYADFAEKNKSVFATAKKGGRRKRTKRTMRRRTRRT